MEDFQQFFCNLKVLIDSVEGAGTNCEITNFDQAKCAVKKAADILREEE